MRSSAIARILLFIFVALSATNAVAQALLIFRGHHVQMGFYALVDLDGEGNLPTIYSGALMLAIAAVLGVTGRRLHRDGARGWLNHYFMAALFVYLACDEVFSLHERLSAVVDSVVRTPLVFSWVLPGAAFTIAVFLLSLGFLRSLDTVTRHLVLIAGAMFVGGALGLELVEGWRWAVATNPQYDPINIVCFSIEEMLELSAMSLMLYAMLRRYELLFGAPLVPASKTPERAP